MAATPAGACSRGLACDRLMAVQRNRAGIVRNVPWPFDLGLSRGGDSDSPRGPALDPIPTPLPQRWREFRFRVLPVYAFLGAAAIVVYLWQDTSVPMFSGLGEGVRSTVASPQAGLLQEVLVQPYTTVKAGEPLAVVESADPRTLLSLLQVEIDLVRLRFAPSPAEENAIDYERMRIELLRTRADLAVARINLARAQNDVDRQRALHAEKLVSDATFDLTLKTRDAFQAEVNEGSSAFGQIEERLEHLRSLGDPGASPPEIEHLRVLLDRLESTRTALATNAGLITLYAPIDGVVHFVGRQPGEHVVEGEPLFTVLSRASDRVVGYLRQPYPVEPRVGLSVRVTTRAPDRRRFWSEIVEVGAQIEVITNALAQLRVGALVDVGLPVVVAVPAQAQVRPGEVVDLVITPRSGGAGLFGPD